MVDNNVDFQSWDDIPDTKPTLAAGEYTLRVVGPVLKTTKKGDGQYINYDAVVQDGPDAGYRIFQNMFSLNPKNVWGFKAALKAVAFPLPAGLTLPEAVDYFIKNADGFEFIGYVVKKIGQSKNAEGVYVDDPAVFQNQVKRWVSKVA